MTPTKPALTITRATIRTSVRAGLSDQERRPSSKCV